MSSWAERTVGGDPWQSPVPERRSCLRYKVHSPAYSIASSNSNAIAPHLNEIVDLGEEGMCFQNSAQLTAGESMELSLDFSETRARINTNGKIVWSTPSGRTGVRFQKISPAALHQLRQWLFVNTVVAYANQAGSQAIEEMPKSSPTEFDSIPDLLISELELNGPLLADHTSTLTAIAALKTEVTASTSDVDTKLQRLADHARTLTHASGAAIALAEGNSMVCRASSGPDAPPLGALLQPDRGFSGECVRTGQHLRCEDSETDSRVDRESCRVLGVRSLLAAPIYVNGVVIGILETFSPHAGVFTRADEDILLRLTEIVAETVNPPVQTIELIHDEEPVPNQLADDARRSTNLRRILLGSVVALVLLLLGWMALPHSFSKSKATQTNTAPQVPSTATSGLDGLRLKAGRGDAAAQFSLGTRYAMGDEVKQDYVEAARWFALAADHGLAAAQVVMSAYCEGGTGVPKDLEKAYFWAILAEAQGDEAGRSRATGLSTRISHQQLRDIQQQADEWAKRHVLAGNLRVAR